MDGLMRTNRINFLKCFRCQETDTSKISLSNTELSVVFVGWCNLCNKEYSYSERIVDVHDKEKRI